MMLRKIIFTNGVVVKILAIEIGDLLQVLIVIREIEVVLDQVMLNSKLMI